MDGSLGTFKVDFRCTCCLPGGKVNIDANSDAGILAKARLCELDAAELSALPVRDAAQEAKLQTRRQQATAFRAKLPPAYCKPAPDDG